MSGYSNETGWQEFMQGLEASKERGQSSTEPNIWNVRGTVYFYDPNHKTDLIPGHTIFEVVQNVEGEPIVYRRVVPNSLPDIIEPSTNLKPPTVTHTIPRTHLEMVAAFTHPKREEVKDFLS